MKRTALFFIMALCIMPLFSQSKKDTIKREYGIPQPKNPDIEKILNGSKEFLSDPLGITIEYIVRIKDPKNKIAKGTSGTAKMMGNKFYVFSPEFEAWFDGKTQWLYMRENKEINISEPNDEELASINPMYLLSSYKKYYNCKYLRYSFSNDQEQYVHNLEFIPKKKESDISSINVNIFEGHYAPYLIVINTKEGATTSIKVTKVDQKQQISEETFKFIPSQYEGIDLIDLR